MIGNQESLRPQSELHFSSHLSEDLSRTSNKSSRRGHNLNSVNVVRFGRKPAIIGSAVVVTAGAITMGAAGTKEILLVGRIILGMGIDWFK